MDFEKTYEKMNPKIKATINSIKYYPGWIDKDDLFQEAYLHLWNIWEEKGVNKNTEAYILQGIKFYLKNYIRCIDDGFVQVSLDETMGNDGITFKDLISDTSFPFDKLENKIFVSELLNNGFTKREKQVLVAMLQGFKLENDGYTTREIGELLGISHVRVIKIRKNIKKKIESYLRKWKN